MLVLAFGALAGRWLELVTLFTLVLIHEWGHAVCARALGWNVQSIVLMPFGGALQVIPPPLAPPWHEFVIALAGPLTHVPLIVLGWILTDLKLWSQAMGQFWFEGNMMIFMFNMLPLFPLDGGRMVLALLTRIIPYRMALMFIYGWTLFLSVLMTLLIIGVPYVGYVLKGSLSALLLLPYVLTISLTAFNDLQHTMHRFFLERYMYHETVRMWRVRKVQVKGHWTMRCALRRMYRSFYHIYERESVYDPKRRMLDGQKRCYPQEETNILSLYFLSGRANLTFDQWEDEHCHSSR